MKTISKVISYLFIFSICTTGCKKETVIDTVVTCDHSYSEFSELFNATLFVSHTDKNSYDTEIHEYTFTLSSIEEICEIGYQSQPGIEDTPYEIEIYDNVSAAVVYKDKHVFSAVSTSYVTPTSMISLKANNSYTIRRIITNYGSNIGNTIGRLSEGSTMFFPYTNGNITVTGADFYQNGGPLTNMAIPFIDIIFKD